MRIYIQGLVSNIYAKQNWENSNTRVIDRTRVRILRLSTRAGLPAAEEKVGNLFREWLNSHGSAQVQTIDADIRDIVFTYGMKYTSQSEWDKLWQIYKSEDDARERQTLAHALAAPCDTEILKKLLTLSWDESNFRNQEFQLILAQVSFNPWGLALAWDFLREHWTQIVDRCTLNDFFMWYILHQTTNMFDTEDRLKEMESFFQQHPKAGAGAGARERVLDTVRNNIAWAATRAPSIAAWLHTSHNMLH